MTVREDLPVRHASLAAGGAWTEAELTGLQRGVDGALELLAVPRVIPPSIRPPGDVAPSGVAVDDDCGLYLSDARARRIVRRALDCRDPLALAGAGYFVAPAGLAIGPFGWLFVADPGSGGVIVLTLPGLTVRDVWRADLEEPVGVAAHDRAVYVLDAAGAGRVIRFDPFGRLDAAVTGRLAGVGAPVAVATGPDRLLYVGDRARDAVLRFDDAGVSAGADLAVGMRAHALAVAARVLFVADRSNGEIRLVATGDGGVLGRVEGVQGPVAALAADRAGRLYIKPGDDDRVVIAEPGEARVARGTLSAGPLDAGEENGWLRAAVDATAGGRTRVALETFESDQLSAPLPAPASALDTLLGRRRYLWLRVTLERDPDDLSASPSVAEVRAATAGDGYERHLPAVYSRKQAAGDFLGRLLALAQSELGDLESTIERLPRRIDPRTAPPSTLAGLADWQAFDVPMRLRSGRRRAALRALLAELPGLYRRRGTPAGVARFAQLYAGVRPVLVENHRWRRGWLLDGGAVLGFDTGLAERVPDGIVIGESAIGGSGPEEPQGWGAALFDATAHRFTVLAPAAAVAAEDRLRAVIDAEKPAHTAYHLCLAGPRLRVGVQATLGVDAIVAGPRPGMELDGGTPLGLATWTQDEGAGGGAVARPRVGIDTVVG
jgi:phage tail-like protein